MGNKNKSSSSVASNLNILKTTHTFIHLQTHCNYSTKKGSLARSLTHSQQHSFIQPHSPQQKKFTNLVAASKQRSVQTKQNKTNPPTQHKTKQNKTKNFPVQRQRSLSLDSKASSWNWVGYQVWWRFRT